MTSCVQEARAMLERRRNIPWEARSLLADLCSEIEETRSDASDHLAVMAIQIANEREESRKLRAENERLRAAIRVEHGESISHPECPLCTALEAVQK